MKADLFGNNEVHWSPIRDKVESWVRAGWATWEEEKPEWFTDQWKSIVPEDMKPTRKMVVDVDDGDKTADENAVEEALMAGGGEEQNGRRKSILEFVSGQKVASSKVMPAGRIKKEIDAEEFVRELKRRGSINM